MKRKPEPTPALPALPEAVTPGATKAVIRRCANELVNRLRAGRQLTLLEWVLAEELLTIPRWKYPKHTELSISVLVQSLRDARLQV